MKNNIFALLIAAFMAYLTIPPLMGAKLFVEANCDHVMDTGIPAGTINPDGYIAQNQVYRCEDMVQRKLDDLCQAYPDQPCEDLQDYCREALEKGGECYVFPEK